MFQLTESILSQIIFAMENQNDESVLVSNKDGVSIVPFSQIDSEINPEDVYSLPKWFSSDGFDIFEKFTQSLSDSSVKRELRNVLVNGRGVFKNFKSVLKNYPETEIEFRLFKEKKMKDKVFEWYDSLRENQNSDDEKKDLNLIFEDFVFKQYDYSADRNCIEAEFESFSERFCEKLKIEHPDDIGIILSNIWKQRESEIKKLLNNCKGFVCRTLSEEFVGCFLFTESPTVARESVTLTTCFVKENFRGLGIAKKLFLSCVSFLRERNFHTFFVADSFIPNDFEKMLLDLGFEKIYSFYAARF